MSDTIVRQLLPHLEPVVAELEPGVTLEQALAISRTVSDKRKADALSEDLGPTLSELQGVPKPVRELLDLLVEWRDSGAIAIPLDQRISGGDACLRDLIDAADQALTDMPIPADVRAGITPELRKLLTDARATIYSAVRHNSPGTGFDPANHTMVKRIDAALAEHPEERS